MVEKKKLFFEKIFSFFFVFCSKIGGKMKKDLKKLAVEKNWYFLIYSFLSKHSFRSVCFIFGTIGCTKSSKPFQKKSPEKIFLRRSLRERNSGIFPWGSAWTHPYVAVYRLLQPLAFSGVHEK